MGSFSYCCQSLGLGSSAGNQFDVTLRDLKGGDHDTVIAAVNGLARNGFVNYYGLQRFGGQASPTHRYVPLAPDASRPLHWF